VRLSLLEAAPGETISVAFSRTPDALRQAVSDFVDIFNSVRREFAAAGSANGRNPALNAIDRQLAAMLSEAVTGDPSVNSLSDIGITTNRDGSVSLDSARFEAALSTNPQAIERMFVPQGDDVGLPGRIAEINALADGNDSRLDALRQRLEDQIEQIDIDRDKVELREANYRNRLQEQFGAMDARISALRATQSYLEQQIAIWTNSN
jgi:flagellar hook-associated protein 2